MPEGRAEQKDQGAAGDPDVEMPVWSDKIAEGEEETRKTLEGESSETRQDSGRARSRPAEALQVLQDLAKAGNWHDPGERELEEIRRILQEKRSRYTNEEQWRKGLLEALAEAIEYKMNKVNTKPVQDHLLKWHVSKIIEGFVLSPRPLPFLCSQSPLPSLFPLSLGLVRLVHSVVRLSTPNPL